MDPSKVNEELGGPIGHAWLCETLLKEGLGQLMDVVPNHMAIANDQNPWWRDVLENGQSSPYAKYFDVDGDSSGDRWPDKVLFPFSATITEESWRRGRSAWPAGTAFSPWQFPVRPSPSIPRAWAIC